MATWHVKDVAEHVAEILDDADANGPQIIAAGARERSVVLSIDTYRKLAGEAASEIIGEKQYVDFKDWLLNGPQLEDDDPFFNTLQQTRKDLGRHFEFEDE